jgi:hypothetical protein
MNELKIYCSVCGEPMTEILKHHIDKHDYETMTVDDIKQKIKNKYKDDTPIKILDSAIKMIGE